ncbi:hypothetical protein Q9Q99_00660 [Curtobacterium flaccumfaciens]|nr:hypothetical protein Q9Q99_00660 [Curtobacterium flaccumfaciens]
MHRLLAHLHEQGFVAALEPIALGDTLETVSFVPGVAGEYPWTEDIASEAALVTSARLLRQFHDAAASFPRSAGGRPLVPSRPGPGRDGRARRLRPVQLRLRRHRRRRPDRLRHRAPRPPRLGRRECRLPVRTVHHRCGRGLDHPRPRRAARSGRGVLPRLRPRRPLPAESSPRR